MALSFSTGLVNAMLSPSAGLSFGEALAGCIIDIYPNSVAMPAKANDSVAAGATKLGTVTKGGVSAVGDPSAYSMHFGEPTVTGTIDKSSSEVWQFTAGASGIAGWFRLRLATDTGETSNTAFRIDGTIGVNGDAVIITTDIVANNIYTFSRFRLTWQF